MKPLIGITTASAWECNRIYNKISACYAISVELGGGLPVLLPVSKDCSTAGQIVERLDGLLLSGGDENVEPHRYCEPPQRGIDLIDPDRDEWEFTLFRAMVAARKPVLGICRGCQVINVAAGGSLIQNIHLQVENCLCHLPMQTERHHLLHTISFTSGSQLEKIFAQPELRINSFHNQAIKEVAPGYQVTATAEDSIIEAIESETQPFVIGVQWHPEALTQRHKHFIKLFKAFVAASRQRTPLRQA